MKKYLVFAVIFLAPLFALAEGFDSDLQFGMQNNSDVTKLQELLTDEGLYSGPISGNFFSLTLKAVKKFQTREGIKSSGYFGLKTRTRANVILATSVGESKVQASTESVAPPVAVSTALPKTTDDVVAKLTEQLALLVRQIEELQKQQTTLQNIQTEQKTQSLILSGIEMNTAPPDPNPLPPPAPAPSVPTKLKLNRWENNSSVTASGAACEGVYFEASVFDQYGGLMKDQKITIITPLGTLTKTTGPVDAGDSPNLKIARFSYTPTSTSTQETVTFTSNDLSFSGKIYVLNRLQDGIEAGKAKFYDGKWTILAWGLEYDPVTKMCINNLATKTNIYLR